MKTRTLYRFTLLFLLTFAFGLFWGAQQVFAQDEPTPAPEMTSENPQECSECHIDITLNWESSNHAQTFHTEAFQTALSDGADPSCYACHTTGYTPFNGEFSHEGVTCAACHGETPANHPDEPVAVLPGLDVCAECHTTTYDEWEVSAHGNAEMPCTSCHDPHEQALRFDTAQELCTNCHTEERPQYVHTSHEDQMCSDCHWHRGVFDSETHVLTGGLSASGHDGQVETLACIDCHENEAESVAVADAASVAGPETSLIVQELETEIANVRAQGENEAAVRLVQGIVVGLAAGAILAFLFIRLSPGRRVKE